MTESLSGSITARDCFDKCLGKRVSWEEQCVAVCVLDVILERASLSLNV